jgi:hypothetical protein
MGLFDFFKKKEAKPEPQENNVLLAMPLFNNGDTFDFSKTIDHLKDFWALPVGEYESNDSSSMVKVGGHNIIIAEMPMPIPKDDIDGTAAYAYNWPNASAELEKDYSILTYNFILKYTIVKTLLKNMHYEN